MVLDPLGLMQITPEIAALPKADLHLHQETTARIERIAARRQGRPSYDWQGWARRLLDGRPPGMGRLADIYEPDSGLDLDGLSDADPEIFVRRVADILEEAAADGAILVEVRFGGPLPDNFMELFREAERRVRERYPRLRAEAIGFVLVSDDLQHPLGEPQLEACLRAAADGLAGIDFRVDPYDTEADSARWETAYRWAERAADAGLGITVHAGEFSTANLEAAARVPGLKRLGHAVYAAADERLLDLLAERGVTVECSLTCNVILGAVPAYEAHPIRRFVERGIPVTLNTDLPVHTATTIGREYAAARALGFSSADLVAFTRNAVQASFTSDERRAELLEMLDSQSTAL